MSGAAAVAAAASELPLSPRGDIPPHPDQLSEYEGTKKANDNHVMIQSFLICMCYTPFCFMCMTNLTQHALAF